MWVFSTLTECKIPPEEAEINHRLVRQITRTCILIHFSWSIHLDSFVLYWIVNNGKREILSLLVVLLIQQRESAVNFVFAPVQHASVVWPKEVWVTAVHWGTRCFSSWHPSCSFLPCISKVVLVPTCTYCPFAGLHCAAMLRLEITCSW